MTLLETLSRPYYEVTPADVNRILRADCEYIPSADEVDLAAGLMDHAERRYRAAADASEEAHRNIVRHRADRDTLDALINESCAIDSRKVREHETFRAWASIVSVMDARRNSVKRTLRFA